MLCFRCGSQVAAGAAACQNCGQQISATQRTAMSPSGRMSAPTLPRVIQRTLQSPLPFKLNDVAADRYQILRLIGEGPLGVVYVAHDRETEVELALKVIRPTVLSRPQDRDAFFEAMALVRGVGHFNLNHVIDVDRDGERCFYTAPLLEGLSLRKLMALRRSRTERFGLAEVVPIAAQVADALQAGGRIGPHGDLKPDNIVILPEMLKVTDFGLAAGIPRGAFVAAQQRTAESSAYLAPEIREGAAPDARSDLYSFGVLLAELLSGQIATGAPVRLRDYQPGLPDALEDVVNRLLDEDPGRRPESAEEAVQDLAAAESGTARSAMPVPVRRTFGPEQTQRISMDMLEEVLETSEGMDAEAVDEEAFAKSIEEQAQAIDRQAEAALASDGLTDPTGMPIVSRSRSEPPGAVDVTQRLSTEMVVEMLQGEAEQTSESSRPRSTDDLDPRLVRAALGIELDDADPLRTDPALPVHDFDEGTDETARGLPPMLREPVDLAPGERTEPMVEFEDVASGEVRTTLERPLPETTGPSTPLPPADLVFSSPATGPSEAGAPTARAAPAPRTVPPRPPSKRPTVAGVAPPPPRATGGAPRPPASAPVSMAPAGRPAAVPPAPRPAGAGLAARTAAAPASRPPAAPPAAGPRPSPRPGAPPGATLPGAAGPALPAVPPRTLPGGSGAPAPSPGAAPAPPPPMPAMPPPARPAAPGPTAAPPAAVAPAAAPAAAVPLGSPPRPTSRPRDVAIREAEPQPAQPSGTSDEWYAQGGQLTTGEIDIDVLDEGDSGEQRREKTRIVPRYEEPPRDAGGFWVWVALAIGASAFLVGAGFYYRRYQQDRAQEQLRQNLLQHPEQSPVPLPPGIAPPGIPQPTGIPLQPQGAPQVQPAPAPLPPGSVVPPAPAPVTPAPAPVTPAPAPDPPPTPGPPPPEPTPLGGQNPPTSGTPP